MGIWISKPALFLVCPVQKWILLLACASHAFVSWKNWSGWTRWTPWKHTLKFWCERIYAKRWDFVFSEVKGQHIPLHGQHLISQEGLELSVLQPSSSLWLLTCSSRPHYICFQCWGLIPGPGMCKTSTLLLRCISVASATSFWSPNVFGVECVKICVRCQSFQD